MSAELEYVSRALRELDDHELAVAREACTALLEAVVSRERTDRLLNWAVGVCSSVSLEGMERAATIARAAAAVDGHDLTVAERPDGMWLATCSCGWRGWPCLDESEADSEPAQWHAEEPEPAHHLAWADRDDAGQGWSWWCICRATEAGFAAEADAETSGRLHEVANGEEGT